MCVVGMDESCGSLGSVPPTAVICVSSEGGDLVGNSVLRDSWRYHGVVVLVSTERWWSHILHTAMDMLVGKHLSGSEVGFAGYKRETIKALLVGWRILVPSTMCFGMTSLWTKMGWSSGEW